MLMMAAFHLSATVSPGNGQALTTALALEQKHLKGMGKGGEKVTEHNINIFCLWICFLLGTIGGTYRIPFYTRH